jgi:hypothetical protein
MAVKDLSDRVQGTPISSMSAGNTQGNPASPRQAMTAPGGESILPASPTTDNLLDDFGGRTEDYGQFIGQSGQADSRPAQGGEFKPSGSYDPASGIWRQT